MEFTLQIYKYLIDRLVEANYVIQTFDNFINRPKTKVVILRHDVDLLPQNSLRFAKIQSQQKIKGTYYFRAVPESWDENIIKEIAALGHEVGYHYENMDVAAARLKIKVSKIKVEPGTEIYDKLLDAAWDDFRYNLDKFRKLVPVSTICMHGSPRSQFDNKALWSKYNYRDLGIIGAPYFDVDFNNVFYLTDTGRRWDGWKVSVRDKVPQQEDWIRRGWVYHSTKDIIKAIESDNLPNQVMMTFHPQRWNDAMVPWTKELILQNMKNVVKKKVIQVRSKKE